MPATATPDPESIESEVDELKERRDRLQSKRDEVGDQLTEARTALQQADDEESQDQALSKAERLQTRADTLDEAITEVEVDLEALRDQLTDARAARRREETLEELAELGRAAIQAREEYDDVRDELVNILKEYAPKLARLRSEWTDAAKTFRSTLKRTNGDVYPHHTATDEDEEQALSLIEELKERGCTPFKNCLRPHATPRPNRWLGWSENGYTGPGGKLGTVLKNVRAIGLEKI